MSLLSIEVLPNGMIFAADRNVTVSVSKGGVMYQTQEVGSKVLRWPGRRALIGFVGLGNIADQSMYDWLFEFIGEHTHFSESQSIAFELRDSLQRSVGQLDPPRSLIVEFGTFGVRNGVTVPEMWHVTNIPGMNNKTGEYLPAVREFIASEEILGHHLSDVPAQQLREHLAQLARQYDPFWFHQSIDLAVFNTLQGKVKEAFRTLHQSSFLPRPNSLEDWERHARMWVLMFGAYYESFGGPGERYVGGGADVYSMPWPDSA